MKSKVFVLALLIVSVFAAKANYDFLDWDVSCSETAFLVDEETGEAFFPETAVSGWDTSNPSQGRDIYFCPGAGVKCVLKVGNGGGGYWLIYDKKTPGGPDMIIYAV